MEKLFLYMFLSTTIPTRSSEESRLQVSFLCSASGPQATGSKKQLYILPINIYLSFPSKTGLSKYVVSSYHTRSYQRAVSWSHVGDQLIGHLLSLTFSVVQTTDVVLYSLDKYTKTVFVQEFTWAGAGAGAGEKVKGVRWWEEGQQTEKGSLLFLLEKKK